MNDAVIRRCNPRDPGATALLMASHGLMTSMFPSERKKSLASVRSGKALPGIDPGTHPLIMRAPLPFLCPIASTSAHSC